MHQILNENLSTKLRQIVDIYQVALEGLMRYSFLINCEFGLSLWDISWLFLKMSGRNKSLRLLFDFLSEILEEIWYFFASSLVIDFVYDDEVGGFDIFRYFPVSF